MRINQVWIIMNNGICPIHILYSGQMLEENLFAAFVRALFSFSKDMSKGENSISSMTLGDMDIHYLAEPNEKFFVAISAEVGIPEEDINVYLQYINKLFSLYYFEYIEELPAYEPESFVFFKNAIDYFITFTEDTITNKAQGIEDLDLKLDIKSLKFSSNNILIQNPNDKIIRTLNKDSLNLTGTFYPELGEIKFFDIQRDERFIVIISDNNYMTIIPFLNNNEQSTIQTLKLEADVTWICCHPEEKVIFFGSENEIHEYNINMKVETKHTVLMDIRQVLIHKSNKMLLKTKEQLIYIVQLPIQNNSEYKALELPEKILSIDAGPKNTIIMKCSNQLIRLWDTEEKMLTLKDRYSENTSISFSENKNIIFLITEYNEFHIYDSLDASLMVNYNLVERGLGAFISEEEKLIVLYANGEIKRFLGTVDKNEIAQLRNFLTKRVENVENNIIRIHSGFQKIVTNLDNKMRSSLVLKNDLNQIKVFKQQLKKLIDDKLIERTSILSDLYFRLLGYQNQVQNLIKLIEELEGEVESSFKKSKENELSGKTPKERIEDYLNLMKPRDQIGLGSLADDLQLPYEECLNHLRTLESRGLLPGFLTRGSALSIKDSVIFVKKDPKFEETGITSF